MNYYNDNLIDDIDYSVVLSPFFEEWLSMVKDILLHDEFQKRKLFMHHKNMSVWEHSILVSFSSFMMAKYFNADKRVCAIAGLLHDFYSQAWIRTPEIEALDNGKYAQALKVKKTLFKMHGFTHAKDAAMNYVKYFPELEDKKITNSIKRHMFPLNIIPPRYKEGFIITLVDKWNSVHELPDFKTVNTVVKHKLFNYLFNRI